MIRFFARCKVYGQRATAYLGIAGHAMVLRVFLAQQGVTSWAVFAAILAASAAALLLLMYFEDRAGVFEAETEIQWDRSPQLRKIIEVLDDSLDQSEQKP